MSPSPFNHALRATPGRHHETRRDSRNRHGRRRVSLDLCRCRPCGLTGGMLAMVCWDQVDAKTRKMVEGHLKDMLKAPVKDAALEDYTDFPFKTNLKAVSYTHLTLPTNREV